MTVPQANPGTPPAASAAPAPSSCPHACPVCGGPNGCEWARRAVPADPHAPAGPASCWCFTTEIPRSCIARAAGEGSACVCHACVAKARRNMPWDSSPRAGETYRLDDGRMVFTERYHLRRGYCCGNGCRHCPYDAMGRPRRVVPASVIP